MVGVERVLGGEGVQEFDYPTERHGTQKAPTGELPFAENAPDSFFPS
jgi:hypothetical protein